MASNPYATPESNVTNEGAEIIPTSLWTAKGRLSVLSYLGQTLLFTIVYTIVLFAALFGAALIFGSDVDMSSLSNDPGSVPPALWAVLILIYAVVFYISWCMIIKRLHDRNMKGWWSLLLLVPPITLVILVILFIPSQGKGQANRFGAWRTTRGWEKVLGILYAVLLVGSIVASVAGFAYLGTLGS